MSLLGQSATLEITSTVDFGVFLDAGDLGEVLLPKKHCHGDEQVGDEKEVFIYLDSSDRPIATCHTPKLKVGQFALLNVKEVGRFGAFLDWGLEKDLLLPFSEQKKPLEAGNRVLVYLYVDKVDNRLTATTKLDKHLNEDGKGVFKNNQKVDLIIANSTDLGYKAIINHSHWGLIFHQDITERVYFGQELSGFVKQVRQDGKINLTLTTGQQDRDKHCQAIIDYLNQNDGFVAIHDKSDPALIKRVFSMSKGAYKKAIGNLYKQGVITISDKGIELQNR